MYYVWVFFFSLWMSRSTVLATGSATELNPIMQRPIMQRPSPLLLRTPIVVGSQQAVATGTRSQAAAVTLQVLPSNSPQSAKAVEEVGYIIASSPGFCLGPKEPTLFVTHLLLIFLLVYHAGNRLFI